MKNKRTIAVATALCLSLSACVMLSACGNKGKSGEKDDTVTATIQDLTLGIGESVTVAPVYSDTGKASTAWTFAFGTESVATADGLTIRGAAVGETAVTGTDANGVSAAFNVEVVAMSVSAPNQTVEENGTLALNAVINVTHAPDDYNAFGWDYSVAENNIVTLGDDDVLTPTGKEFGDVTVTATYGGANAYNAAYSAVNFTVTVTETDYISLFNTVGAFEFATIDAAKSAGIVLGGDAASAFTVSTENAHTGSSGLQYYSAEESEVKGTASFTVKHLDTAKTYSLGAYIYSTASVWINVLDDTGTVITTLDNNAWKYSAGNWERSFMEFVPTTDTVTFEINVQNNSWTDGTNTTWNGWAAIDDITLAEGSHLEIVGTNATAVTYSNSVKLSYASLATAYASAEGDIKLSIESSNTDKVAVDDTAQTVTAVKGAEGTVALTVTATQGDLTKVCTVNITCVADATLAAIGDINAAGTFTNASASDWTVTGAGWTGVIGSGEWINGDHGGAYNQQIGTNILYKQDLTFAAGTYNFSLLAQGGGTATLALYASTLDVSSAETVAAATALFTKSLSPEGSGWENAETLSLSVTFTEETAFTLVLTSNATDWLCIDNLVVAKA